MADNQNSAESESTADVANEAAGDLALHQIPTRQDNYVYVLTCAPANAPEENVARSGVVIDPSDADPVLAFVERESIRLTEVWCTHHHGDHVGGNRAIVGATGARVRGPAAERIPAVTDRMAGSDRFAFAGRNVEVLDLGGHTAGHIGYWIPDASLLFCGDTLFSLGCGRLFEGTPSQMWASLQRIAALPDSTRICCAHEYTLANAAFARTVDPANPALLRRIEEAKAQRRRGEATVPSRLGDEKAANPFLRAPSLAKGNPVEAFAALRHRKDSFAG